MDDLFNGDTGEVIDAPSISEAAIQARKAQEVKPPQSGMDLESAIFAAIGELPVWITKDKQGAHNAKYATLKAILSTVRPVLMKHGIRIRQGAAASWTLDGGGIKGRLVPVYTDLVHVATGQVERTTIEIPVTKLDAMAMGSAMLYGRRYTLLSALGLATDEAEDDGKATRSAKLDDEHQESQELWVLKEEIRGIDTVEKLKSWGDKIAATRKTDDLDEGEQLLLKQAFKARLHELAEAKAEKAKK